MKKDTISIAIAGHANTGKTTLLRCLIKNRIGEVADKSGVTKISQIIYHNGIIRFIDTPGLERAGEALTYRKFYNNDMDYENVLKSENMELELEVIKTLKQDVDLVYYISSLDSVPDRGVEQEIKLIKLYNNRIIGIINKFNNSIFHDKENQSILMKRLDQWKSFFTKHEISSICYDFHWDNPQKQLDLYDETEKLLNKEEKLVFKKLINNVENDNNLRRKKIKDKIKDTLDEIKSLSVAIVIDEENNNKQNPDKIKKNIINQCIFLMNTFTNNICEIYQVPSIEQLQIRKMPAVTKIEKILVSASDKKKREAVDGLAAGALIGGILTIPTAIATGGLFLIPLAIGVGIGSIWGGGYGVVQEQIDTKKIEYTLKESELFEISKFLIAIVWTIAYYGYEKNHITKDKSNRINNLITEEIPLLLKKHSINESNFIFNLNILLSDLAL